MKNIEQTLRDAAKESGQTVYALHRSTGLHTAPLYKFLAGEQSLRLNLAAKLAEHLGYELRKVDKPKTTKGK